MYALEAGSSTAQDMSKPLHRLTFVVIVHRDCLLNPEKQTAKSPRHEGVKGQFSSNP
jgi:hypothetical protein